MANQKITLDATSSPAMTNQVGLIALTSRNFRFGDVLASGRDLQLYDSDQSTAIAHSLRTWGHGGLRLLGRTPPPTSLDPDPYKLAVVAVAATMGFGNDPHTIRAWGADYKTDPTLPVYGIWNCYDRLGAKIWTFQTQNHQYPTALSIADIDGDGIAEVMVGCKSYDHKGFVLNGTDGTLRWSWDMGQGSFGYGNYCRVAAAGDLRTDLAGLEVVLGGSDGHLAMFAAGGGSPPGTPIWSNQLSQPGGNQSVQGAVIADLDNTGVRSIYCVQGEYIRKIDNTGSTLWTYIHSRSGSFLNNYYSIAAGHITSTTTKQVVAASASQDFTNHLGVCTVLNSDGTVAWEKVLPVPCWAVAVGDVDGDGYDEVLISWGNSGNTSYVPGAWGALLVLDRNGDELASTSFGGASKYVTYGDTDGDGIPEILVACEDGYHYRYAWDPAGATVKATIPSVGAASTRNLYAASAGSTILPPLGDYLFNLAGADGATPTGWTQQLGTWTIQGGKLQSQDDGDTSGGIRSCELTGSSTDGLELEFTGTKPGQGTGVSTYYLGCRYRCTSWTSGLPAGYYVQVGSNGNVTLIRSASGTATAAATPFNSNFAAMQFNATDVMKYRVVASGIYHSLAWSKNGSPWKIAYEVSDSGITAAGSIAFTSTRGQSRYSAITCWSIPSAFGDVFPGPSPVYLADPLNSTVYTVTAPSPSSGVVNVASGPFTVVQSEALSRTITITPSGGGLSTPIVLTFSTTSPQTFTITPTAVGTVTLTPTNSAAGLANPAAVTYAVTNPAANSWQCLAITYAFDASRAGTLGYTVYSPANAVIAARATAGIVRIGNAFVAMVGLPWTGAVLIDWDDGTAHDVMPVYENYVEPDVTATQATGVMMAMLRGDTTGGGLTFLAPDGTPRNTGTVAGGDRTSSTMTPIS